MEEDRSAFEISKGILTGKRPLPIPKFRCDKKGRIGSVEDSTMRNFIVCTVRLL